MTNVADDRASAARRDEAAIQLAELILSMGMVTDKGLIARRLAREVLGVSDHGNTSVVIPITTNGTTRLVPRDEPVFLIRGQDVVGAAAVRAWADLAEANGAAPDVLLMAREHADLMEGWPHKKTPDIAPDALSADLQQEAAGAR
ncbi:hypothetical protein [Burkholderia gladioli]|uniref:hypothetical protein n=1 Tax=Burkholderia gladioli TaxID=28095 RepID=UPI0016402637|nr:hypothetical protein [Burkholderia gladioli]